VLPFEFVEIRERGLVCLRARGAFLQIGDAIIHDTESAD
jgi:hypothetical protein